MLIKLRIVFFYKIERRNYHYCSILVQIILFQATQTNNPDRYATTLVDIYVTAANENPPRFAQKQYTANVVENTPPGSIVATVSAMDNDEVGQVFTLCCKLSI